MEVFEHGIGYVKRTYDRHRWEEKKKKKLKEKQQENDM